MKLTLLILSLASVAAANGAAIITSITTTPATIVDTTMPGRVAIDSFTSGGSVHSAVDFVPVTATGVLPGGTGQLVLWGAGGAAVPITNAGVNGTISDGFLDTGALNNSVNAQYAFANTLSATDLVYIFLNGNLGTANNPLGEVQAYNSADVAIGTALDVSGVLPAAPVAADSLLTVHLTRGNGNTLANRGHYGLTLEVSELGATAADIAYVQFTRGGVAGESFDVSEVGVVTPVPEPSSAILVGLGVLGFMSRRRR